MGLTKIRLGYYIERSTVNNKNLVYGTDLIVGVTNEGVCSTPKGNPIGVDLRPYKIVNHGAFVYNPTRLDLGSIAYREDGLCIVSHLYIVFYLNEAGKKIIDPQYLFIYFRRKEFCREVTFRNFGSQRPEFSFSDMCDIVIPLPPYAVQQKYVAVYNAMIANQQSYERRLEDLKLVCDAYIENLRKHTPAKTIGQYLIPCEQRNDIGLSVDFVRGLSVSKQVITTKANMDGVSLTSYKLFPPKAIAYVADTSRRGDKMSLGFNDSQDTYLVSSISTVFKTDENYLLPEYLMLFFCRDEFDRYARFHSWGSARETFDWDEMCSVEIPVPDIAIQQDIVDIFKAYNTRKDIAEKLKNQIQNICPILIKGSIEEGMRANEA